MERFLAQRVVQRVVIELDLHRGGGATVDDAGNLARATQAAARTRALHSRLAALTSISIVFLQFLQ